MLMYCFFGSILQPLETNEEKFISPRLCAFQHCVLVLGQRNNFLEECICCPTFGIISKYGYRGASLSYMHGQCK